MMLNEKALKGLKAELLAKHYLIKKGYIIFSAEGGIGPIDLVGILDGKTRYFDVKTTGEVKEHTFDKGEWHKKYKIGRNEKGHYTGEILKR